METVTINKELFEYYTKVVDSAAHMMQSNMNLSQQLAISSNLRDATSFIKIAIKWQDKTT